MLPQPRHFEKLKGCFALTSCTERLQLPDSMATPLRSYLHQLGWGNGSESGKAIVVRLQPYFKGGYRMSVRPDSIVIDANDYQGIVSAVASLRQLEKKGSVESCFLIDYPEMAWRGAMIDVSRHFFPIDFLKKQVDVMAQYKLNSLHLHLTDAAGWRMEIKQYPRLTDLAAWRRPGLWKTWWNGERRYVEKGSPEAYGGYYTQAQLKDLVAYAALRGINIVPEIEMPAHSEEVLTAYPQYSCTHQPYKQADFCPGNDSVYTFLQNILTEVMQVFPSPYIHIGGDEAGKASWPTCPLCQKRMAEEHLNGVEGLQGYLVRRMAKFLQDHGRCPIGWDEVLSDSLRPGTTVMVWRDANSARQAAEKGLNVILSPGSHCYLDGYQDAPPFQPEAIGGYTTLERVYSFRPLEVLTREQRPYLTGIQGNLWTEYVPTTADAERMLYPRLLALAEIGWNGTPQQPYAEFRKKALLEIKKLRAEGVNTFDLAHEYGQRKEYLRPVSHLAVGKPVTYNVPLKPNYAAEGATTLTDGKRGGWSYGDKRWQGFIGGACLDVTIDLQQEATIKSVTADFLQSCGPEIYFPGEVTVSVSSDGQHFSELSKTVTPFRRSDLLEIKPFGFKGKAKGRYVRLQASTVAQGGWLFTDEIVVK